MTVSFEISNKLEEKDFLLDSEVAEKNFQCHPSAITKNWYKTGLTVAWLFFSFFSSSSTYSLIKVSSFYKMCFYTYR
jgi:hypothetical protein